VTDEYALTPELDAATVLRRLYDLGIRPDWWKLEPQATRTAWQHTGDEIRARDPFCRGVVLLGLDASVDTLAAGFAEARGSATCRGFAVGRTIFKGPSAEWLEGKLDDAGLKARVRANFESLIDLWQGARAGRAQKKAAA